MGAAHPLRVLDREVDQLVAELGDELRLPVVVEPGRVARVEQLLHGRVGHRPDDVDRGRSELAKRPEQLLAVLRGRDGDRDHADDVLSL